MAISKIILNNEIQMDVTSDTVTADKLMQGYTAHDRTGALITGTATGGGGAGVVWQDQDGYIHLSDEGGGVEYTRTLICPTTSFSVASAGGYYTLSDSGRLVDGENYVITYDQTEFICSCEELYGTDRFLGDLPLSWGNTSADYLFPFCIEDWNNNTTPIVYARDTSAHTVKIERLDFITDGTTLTTKSITANGTYNASSDSADGYSSVTVNVSGGGGLVYETGTWTPSADVTSDTTILFTNTHTEPPFYYMVADADTTTITDGRTATNIIYSNSGQVFGGGAPVSSSTHYGSVYYGYTDNNTPPSTYTGASHAQITTPYNDSSSSSSYNSRYWATETSIKIYNSRTWRAGRTYKWIAVWAPTT